MLINSLLIILGLGLLLKGADWLVDGASALAKRYNVSDLAIGLTIVAFGTSAPEMVVNIYSSFQQHSDIVFGNILKPCLSIRYILITNTPCFNCMEMDRLI